MTTHRKLLFAGFLAIGITGLIVALNASQGTGQQTVEQSVVRADPPRPPQEKTPETNPGKAADAKAIPAKEPTKTGPKVLSMAEAVVIAERVGKGYTMKAERKEKPSLTFKFEILSRTGQKVRVELDPDGTVRNVPSMTSEERSEERRGGEKKGPSKKSNER